MFSNSSGKLKNGKYILHWMPLYVITFGPSSCDHIKQTITKTDNFTFGNIKITLTNQDYIKRHLFCLEKKYQAETYFFQSDFVQQLS